jgi:thymidylate synthase
MVQTTQYLDLVKNILENGEKKTDRTGVGTISIFAPPPMVYDLSKTFPLVTAKRVAFKSMASELLWMISGSTNNNDLLAMGSTIWNEWAKPNGDLGKIYGYQWRKASRFVKTLVPKFGKSFFAAEEKWEETHVDQLGDAINLLKNNPGSRRIVVDAWQVQDLNNMSLTPCHMMFQLYRRNDGTVDLQMYQRSADCFLGVPFNIASYALLLTLIAKAVGGKPGKFTHVLGDAHIYLNHIDQCKEMLSRPLVDEPQLDLTVDCPTDIDLIKLDHIELIGYHPHPSIKGPVAV